MEIVKNVITVLYIILCVALIIVATIQAKDSSGASETITGSSTNNFYEKNKGKTKEGKMKRLTILLSILFVVFSIALGILYMV